MIELLIGLAVMITITLIFYFIGRCIFKITENHRVYKRMNKTSELSIMMFILAGIACISVMCIIAYIFYFAYAIGINIKYI